MNDKKWSALIDNACELFQAYIDDSKPREEILRELNKTYEEMCKVSNSAGLKDHFSGGLKDYF